MLADRQCARTATTDIHLMHVRRMATTDLTGSLAECLLAPGHGMGDITVEAAGVRAITAMAITAVEVITVALVITAARAMATVAAPPMQGAVSQAVPEAATVPAMVVGLTVEQVVSTAAAGAADGGVLIRR